MQRMWRTARWVFFGLALVYAAAVMYAYPHYHQIDLDAVAVAKITAQKLHASDVDGSRLPPSPDPEQTESTVAGVDENGNGIRDDVELAIFAKYPTSTALRAAELQYAMNVQMQITQVFDAATWRAAAIQRDRGFGCLYDATPEYATLEKEVDELVLNTERRTGQFSSIERYRSAYTLAHGPDCDVTRD